MSKLQVGDSKATTLECAPLPTSVGLIIEQGRKINSARGYGKMKPVNQRIGVEKLCEESKFEVYKILYPGSPTYPRCRHHGGYIEKNRNIDLLAQPKKYPRKSYPRWVKKSIPLASLRVNALSQPKPIYVLDTLTSHLNCLSIAQIENFLSHLFKSDYATPAEAFRDMKQSLKQRRCRVKRQRREIRKLYKRLTKARASNCEELSSDVLTKCSPYVRKSKQQDQLEGAQGEAAILKETRQLMKQKYPHRNSKDLVGRVFVSVDGDDDDGGYWNADKTDLGSHRNTCENEKLKGCVEIEDYYPHEGEGEGVLVETLESGEAKESGEAEVSSKRESLMSFLRRSQIKLNGNECQELYARIKEIEELQKVAESDETQTENNREDNKSGKAVQNNKISKKSGIDKRADKKRADGKNGAENKKVATKKRVDLKKGADVNKKAGTKKGAVKKGSFHENLADCYGEVNKKPQWDVAWVDRG